ncbi:MAG: DUF3575 domain-containing protein [Macellibacteroides fermentans]|uniref:DUF3575 domain-containing protein n=1 Tax=Macellibacteroides fermentans TaxID=879969 RepID=UPI003AD2656C
MLRKNTFFVLLIFVFGLSVYSGAQTKSPGMINKFSLTEILVNVGKKRNVLINYNPIVTDQVYLNDISYDSNTITTLNLLLLAHKLEIKRAGKNYFYVKPVQIKLPLPNRDKENTSTLIKKEQKSIVPNKKVPASFLTREKIDLLYVKSVSFNDTFPDITRNNTYIYCLQSDTSLSFTLKSNLVLWTLGSPNLALERRLSNHFTAEFMLALNTEKNPQPDLLISYYIQSELRYWFLNAFDGGFIGIHPFYASKGVDKLVAPFGRYSDRNLQPWEKKDVYHNFYGVGVSCGYQWQLNTNWHFEASIGLDYMCRKSNNIELSKLKEQSNKLDTYFWGLSKLRISIVYIL